MKGKKVLKILFEIIACFVLIGVGLSNLFVPETTVVAATDISDRIVKEKHDFHILRGTEVIPVIVNGVAQDPLPDFNVGDRVKFVYRFRIDDLSGVGDGDFFNIDLPNQDYIRIPNSLNDLNLMSSSGEQMGVWRVKDGRISVEINDLVASSDWAENGFFEVEGRLIKEGKGIEIEREGDLTIIIDIGPDPGEEPGEPGGHKDIPELPERFDDFYKEGTQWSGQNVIHWNTSFNLDQLRNMFNGVQVVQKKQMMFIDKLAPQTSLLNQPSINVPVFLSTKDGKLGDYAIATVDLVKGKLAEEMIPQTGETYDEFYTRLQENGKVAYGVHDNTLLVSLGDVPGNGITYYDLFGGKEAFESYLDGLVASDVILQEQAERMKFIYGTEGPSQGNIVGLGISFDVAVEGETGDYKNQALLKWIEDGDETDEIVVEFTQATGGLDVVKAGSVLITKIDGDTGVKIPDVVFRLLKWNETEEKHEEYTPRDNGPIQRKTDEDGKVTFAKLDDGNYKIDEVQGVEGYSDEIIITPDNGEFTINNSSNVKGFSFKAENFVKPALIEKTVKKVWEDRDNQDGLRPKNIRVQLYGDDQAVGAEITLDETNNWSHTWKDLPEKENGNAITYTVKETGVPTGYKSTSEVVDGVIVLTNRHTPAVTTIRTQKVWEDGDNQDGFRPKNIRVQLYGDDKAVGAEITLDETNHWSHTWKDLPEKENGKAITYTVKETGVPTGYKSTSEVVDGVIVLTNRHTPEMITIRGEKIWEDNEDKAKDRPESITVNLLADGKVILNQKVTAKTGWAYQFTNLPKYVKGKEVAYTITEEAVAGYTTKIAGYNLINSYIPDKINISVTKYWEDQNDRAGLRPESVKVQLLANGERIGKEVVLNDANDWKYTWEELDGKNEKGEKIEYTVAEVDVPAGYKESITDDSTGNIAVTNTLKSAKPSIKKDWILPKTGEEKARFGILIGVAIVALSLLIYFSRRKNMNK